MSWALSCLSLRRYYDHVVLYTDSIGKHVLIDLLHLPYTEVNVVFDDFECLPQHWALAKIYTYSIQKEPFIHVDGDVYLSHPLSKDVLSAPLVAQNKEVGTGYYRRMVDNGILRISSIQIPEFIQEEIMSNSIPSYNMGFFGGSDLTFIQYYCNSVFDFFAVNKMNDPKSPNSKTSCNVFFEQAFLAVLAEKTCRNVVSVYDRAVLDNGYSTSCFCDLDNYFSHPFFHLLGGHKRNKSVVVSLVRALLRLYPDDYLQVLGLFPSMNVRLSYNRNDTVFALTSKYPDKCRKELSIIGDSFGSVEPLKLVEWEKMVADSIVGKKDIMTNSNAIVKINPWLCLYELPGTLDGQDLLEIKLHLKCSHNFPLKWIGIAPQVMNYGYRDFPVSEIGHDILTFLSDGTKKLEEIEKYLNILFNAKSETGTCLLKSIMIKEISSMQNRNIICLI